ncbi:MAG: Rieske (2Fe-2S) protein [Planctomycetes bacterium]|nr:Rieske (2Fe-2S) protein [Planctomycetota bacterium]
MPLVRLCSIEEAPAPGKGAHFDVGDGPGIALFNVNGEFRAVEDNCPHMHAPLHDAICARGVITCLWHGWQFDLKTGVSLMSDRIRVKIYDVRLEGNAVFVDVPVSV